MAQPAEEASEPKAQERERHPQQHRRRRLWWLVRGRYTDLTRRVQHLAVESAEFVERAENAVKVIGDFYLARVYRAALERFRVPEWEASVVRRAELASDVAGLLRTEAQGTLGIVLEASIVLLILFEIVWAVLFRT